MEIEFGGAYTRDQVRHAIQLLNKPNAWWGWVKRLIAPVFLVVVLGLLLYAVFSGEEITTYRIVRTGTVILLLGYYTALPYLSSNRLVKQLWGQLDLLGAQRGRADGRGVLWIGAEREAETPWEKFARLREGDGLLVLLTEAGNLHMFPREFFSTQEDWAHFLQLVHQRVKAIR